LVHIETKSVVVAHKLPPCSLHQLTWQATHSAVNLLTPLHSPQEIIKKDKMYTTEYLNDKLYLHYKGFKRIENLEKYTGVKVLWLEGNGLDKIENLEAQTEMRTLYLQENIISKIENLESMLKLDTLNLSKNFVTTIENLAHMKQLHTLILSNNNLKDATSLAGATEIPELHALDVQSCKIDDTPEAILKVLADCKELKVLYLKGNDCVKKIRNYRKMVISTCPNLRYLDDRPVFDDERRRCDKWREVFDATGDTDKAMEAEREEIVAIREEKKAREDRAFKQFEDMVREGQKIKDANRVKEMADNGGQLPVRKMVSTDAKSFSVDGSKIDEKKSEEAGRYIHVVDRDPSKSIFSGEEIIPTEESEVVANARNERWGPGSENRVLSSNEEVAMPPPPPTSSEGGIWGDDEMSEEAKKEAEIEAYYTKTAGDNAAWEKGEKNMGNAASAMDSSMAAELATLQDKTERLNMKKIKENETRMQMEKQHKQGLPLPPPPGSEKVGVGGAWPTKGLEKTNFEELD